MAGYARIGIHPAKALGPGRYVLDQKGRLHPIELGKFANAACIVTVRAKYPVVTIANEPAKPDYAKFANRLRSRPSGPRPAPKPPKVYAQSREACERCGVPGFRGCEHQLPYQEWSA